MPLLRPEVSAAAGRAVSGGRAVAVPVPAAAPAPSFSVRPVAGAGAAAGVSALGAAAGAAALAGRLTGFLTSTVTARVRPCENFWRTCVASLFADAAPLRSVVDRVSGLVGLVVSFCSVIWPVVLGPLRRVNRCCSIDNRANAPLRPRYAE